MISVDKLLDSRRLIEVLNEADALARNDGYIEYGARHAYFTAQRTKYILKEFNMPDEMCEIGGVAGLLHDIGHAITDKKHSELAGAFIPSFTSKFNWTTEEAWKIAQAVGNHNQSPIDVISAALVIADKSDAHRYRLKRDVGIITIEKLKSSKEKFFFAITENDLYVDAKNKEIKLAITIENNMISLTDAFKCFSKNLNMSVEGAKFFDAKFKLVINGFEI